MTRLGEILVTAGFVARDDLSSALHDQKDHSIPIGEILRDRRTISGPELLAALALQPALRTATGALSQAGGIRDRLGTLLIRAGVLTETQLSRALASKGERPLGHYLVDAGIITPAQLTTSLHIQGRQFAGTSTRLGEVLVTAGLISRKQLDAALSEQRGTKDLLGEVLTRQGVAATSVRRGLAIQRGLVSAAIAAAIALSAPAQAQARKGDRIKVSATVVSSFRAQVSHPSTKVLVTSKDLARGFLTVAGASLEVTSNSAHYVQFDLAENVFRAVTILGLETQGPVALSGAVGYLRQPACPNPKVYDLSYRVELAVGMSPGSYELPLTVSVHH